MAPNTSLNIEPHSIILLQGASQQLHALRTTVGDAAAPVDVTAQAEWSSSDDKVVSVAKGLVTAAGVGETTISAKLGDAVASATVTVRVIELKIEPPDATVDEGREAAFKAYVTDEIGPSKNKDVTSACKWTSEKPDVATISPTGVARGVKGGSSTISCGYSSGGVQVTATAKLTVSVDLTGAPEPPDAATRAPPPLPRGRLEKEPYDREQDRERVRGDLAALLVVLLVLVTIFSFVLVYMRHVTVTEIKELLTVVFGPIVALVGAACGFYFGAGAVQMGAAKRDSAAGADPPPTDPMPKNPVDQEQK